MTPNISVRTYRPRQQVLVKGQAKKQMHFTLSLPQGIGRDLACIGLAALVFGLAITQVFHWQIQSLQATVGSVRTNNATMASQYVQLLNDRAQVASKSQVATLAARRLQLFEPVEGQVRRM